MRRLSTRQFPARQRGATLVIALLILVLIMMIGITAISTSSTQFKLAGNLQFEDSAINNAETATTAAENWLSTGTNFSNAGFTTYAAGTTPQLLPIGRLAGLVAPANSPLTMTWTNANSLCGGSIDIACTGGNSQQRYFIEQMSLNNQLLGSSRVVGGRASTTCNRGNTYLITARGQSARGATKFVQSYYSVTSCPAT